jgi:hypothetical protein
MSPGHAMNPGSRAPGQGQLAELWAAAGLHHIESATLTVTVGFATFADWREPFMLGVGPAGGYVARLDEDRRDVLRARCAQLLPSAPLQVAASAWCVLARA